MARRTLSNEVKQGILDGLRNGENKASLATRFKVSVVTIYNYAKTLEVVEVNAGNPDVTASSYAVPETASTAVATSVRKSKRS